MADVTLERFISRVYPQVAIEISFMGKPLGANFANVLLRWPFFGVQLHVLSEATKSSDFLAAHLARMKKIRFLWFFSPELVNIRQTLTARWADLRGCV